MVPSIGYHNGIKSTWLRVVPLLMFLSPLKVKPSLKGTWKTKNKLPIAFTLSEQRTWDMICATFPNVSAERRVTEMQEPACQGT